MNKILVAILTVTILFSLIGCGPTEEVPPVDMELQVTQMKSICELAAIECYYHNVAKFYEEDAVKGFLGIGSKDKHFWVEYSGIVTLGVNMDMVSIEVQDTLVTITLPEISILRTSLDETSLTKDSYIVAKNSADITAEDEVQAVMRAQEHMIETAKNDRALLDSAQQQVMSLLEEYVNNIGDAIGVKYTIRWIHLESSEESSESAIGEHTT